MTLPRGTDGLGLYLAWASPHETQIGDGLPGTRQLRLYHLFPRECQEPVLTAPIALMTEAESSPVNGNLRFQLYLCARPHGSHHLVSSSSLTTSAVSMVFSFRVWSLQAHRSIRAGARLYAATRSPSPSINLHPCPPYSLGPCHFIRSVLPTNHLFGHGRP